MLTISKKVEYGMVLFTYLSQRQGKYVPLKTVVDELALPYRFLAQIAAEMKQSGLVVSREGKGGGYGLGKDWENRTVYDLVVAMGEKKSMVECLQRANNCRRFGTCQIKGVWKKVEEMWWESLKKVKLVEENN